METPAATDHAPFGTLLREARKLRHRSQLDLALQAEVSQRHLSFLESGRAQPSRAMVVTLAEALDLSMRERNRLLNSAGFAGIYPQRRLEAADMAPVREALTMMLRHHEPFPAIVVDRAWNLFSANTAMQRLLAVIDDVDALWGRTCGDAPQNVLKLILHPEGLRPLILNLDEIVPPLLARTARASAGGTGARRSPPGKAAEEDAANRSPLPPGSIQATRSGGTSHCTSARARSRQNSKSSGSGKLTT